MLTQTVLWTDLNRSVRFLYFQLARSFRCESTLTIHQKLITFMHLRFAAYRYYADRRRCTSSSSNISSICLHWAATASTDPTSSEKDPPKIFYSRGGGGRGEVVKNQHWSPPPIPQRTPTLFPKCIKVQLNKKTELATTLNLYSENNYQVKMVNVLRRCQFFLNGQCNFFPFEFFFQFTS